MEQLLLQLLQEDVALFPLEKQSELQKAWEQHELRKGKQRDRLKEKQLEHQLLLPQLRMREGGLLVPLILEEGEPRNGEQLELQGKVELQRAVEQPWRKLQQQNRPNLHQGEQLEL